MKRDKRETPGTATLKQDLARGQIAPVYLFYGEEQYFVEEATNAVRGAALAPGAEEFNLDILSGSDIDGHGILAIATMFPMMGERRLVIVKEFDRVADKDTLVAYFENPAPTTVLVLNAADLDGRQKVVKVLEKHAVVMEFRQFKEYEIPDWIRKHVADRGKTIDPDALQLMQVYSDRSLRDIQNEIDKLFIYVGEKKSIGIADVNAVVGVTREFNVFELQKALGDKNCGRALEILYGMLDAGESAPGIVAGLTRYYQKLWVVQEMKQRGKPTPEIAKFLRLNPAFTKYIDEYVLAAGRVNSRNFPEIFTSLKQVDIHLKTGGMDTRSAFTVLIGSLAH